MERDSPQKALKARRRCWEFPLRTLEGPGVLLGGDGPRDHLIELAHLADQMWASPSHFPWPLSQITPLEKKKRTLQRRGGEPPGEPAAMPPCLNFWASMYDESHHTFPSKQHWPSAHTTS